MQQNSFARIHYKGVTYGGKIVTSSWRQRGRKLVPGTDRPRRCLSTALRILARHTVVSKVIFQVKPNVRMDDAQVCPGTSATDDQTTLFTRGITA